ncbi:hypothetical protein [Dactylosporangium sp. NPDC005555]|uniref:hypothetical protein n=1 Tax=Dactylosporangium sp. NPDC005555 TaxID=3154889 RepID=UPI0033B34653
MTSTALQSRPARTSAALTALVVASAVAFVAAPATLAGGDHAGEGALRSAARGAFVGYWRAGDADLTPAMQRVADYWLRYHVAKAVIAALLLTALTALGLRIWRRYVEADRHRIALAAGGALATAFALGTLAALMANLQGAAAPFASLMPMLVDSPPDAQLAGPLDEVRQQLSGVVHEHRAASPVLQRMIDDYALYHWVIAVIATVVVAVLVAAGVLLWRRRTSATGPARRVLASYGVLSALVALALAVVVVANVGTAAAPGPGFLGFFEGGW